MWRKGKAATDIKRHGTGESSIMTFAPFPMFNNSPGWL